MTIKIQINDEIRNATDEEIVVLKKSELDYLAEKEKQTAEAETQAAAKAALLDRLGITADEAKLLLS